MRGKNQPMTDEPPFRADHVGSFLRTEPLKQARAKHEHKADHRCAAHGVEDREIEKLIGKQEEVGLKLATDGEFRRAFWHFDFWGMLDGVRIEADQHRRSSSRACSPRPQSIRVKGKIDFPDRSPDAGALQVSQRADTRVVPKMTIPSPTVFHFRLEPGAVSKTVYADAGRDFRRSRRRLIARR